MQIVMNSKEVDLKYFICVTFLLAISGCGGSNEGRSSASESAKSVWNESNWNENNWD